MDHDSHYLHLAHTLLLGEWVDDDHYAYVADETRLIYVVDYHDVVDLGRRLACREPDADAYSVWCAETTASAHITPYTARTAGR